MGLALLCVGARAGKTISTSSMSLTLLMFGKQFLASGLAVSDGVLDASGQIRQLRHDLEVAALDGSLNTG